jgi:hypothetical protein
MVRRNRKRILANTYLTGRDHCEPLNKRQLIRGAGYRLRERLATMRKEYLQTHAIASS